MIVVFSSIVLRKVAGNRIGSVVIEVEKPRLVASLVALFVKKPGFSNIRTGKRERISRIMS